MAQYPLDMGRKKKMSNALAIQVDPEGKIKYDAIARQGQSKDKVISHWFCLLVFCIDKYFVKCIALWGNDKPLAIVDCVTVTVRNYFEGLALFCFPLYLIEAESLLSFSDAKIWQALSGSLLLDMFWDMGLSLDYSVGQQL